MKPLGSLLAAATCVVAFVMPRTGVAAPPFANPQCSGAVLVGQGTRTCQADFVIAEPLRPAVLGTHANFHVPMSVGTITMRWIDIPDADDAGYGVVAEWTCNAIGGYASVNSPSGQRVEFGPFDAAPVPNCTERVTPQASYARGMQALVVEARAVECVTDRPQSSCPFHGSLQLQPSILP